MIFAGLFDRALHGGVEETLHRWVEAIERNQHTDFTLAELLGRTLEGVQR